jgi:hypothetical protein
MPEDNWTGFRKFSSKPPTSVRPSVRPFWSAVCRCSRDLPIHSRSGAEIDAGNENSPIGYRKSSLKLAVENSSRLSALLSLR